MKEAAQVSAYQKVFIDAKQLYPC